MAAHIPNTWVLKDTKYLPSDNQQYIHLRTPETIHKRSRITLNCSGYKYERSPLSCQLDSTLRTCIHHPATPVYRLESPVHRTPCSRTIRELLCGLLYYLYIEPCVACVTIRRIHTAGINIYYICILDLVIPPLCIIISLSHTGCCIVKSVPRLLVKNRFGHYINLKIDLE